MAHYERTLKDVNTKRSIPPSLSDVSLAARVCPVFISNSALFELGEQKFQLQPLAAIANYPSLFHWKRGHVNGLTVNERARARRHFSHFSGRKWGTNRERRFFFISPCLGVKWRRTSYIQGLECGIANIYSKNENGFTRILVVFSGGFFLISGRMKLKETRRLEIRCGVIRCT